MISLTKGSFISSFFLFKFVGEGRRDGSGGRIGLLFGSIKPRLAMSSLLDKRQLNSETNDRDPLLDRPQTNGKTNSKTVIVSHTMDWKKAIDIHTHKL